MTDDDYDALSQKQLASIKRDMRISLEDAAVRATYKVMAELETEQNQGEEHMTCGHRQIRTWVFEDTQQPSGLWSCVDCGLKFEPITQRTWVGLTDWEYKELHLQMGPVYYYQEYGQAIEAKLKEKNT